MSSASQYLIRRRQESDRLQQYLRRDVVPHLYLQSLGDPRAESVSGIQRGETCVGQRDVIDQPDHAGGRRRGNLRGQPVIGATGIRFRHHHVKRAADLIERRSQMLIVDAGGGMETSGKRGRAQVETNIVGPRVGEGTEAGSPDRRVVLENEADGRLHIHRDAELAGAGLRTGAGGKKTQQTAEPEQSLRSVEIEFAVHRVLSEVQLVVGLQYIGLS